MKRNLLAITLAMALVIALVFVVAPTTQASAVDHIFTKDGESYSVTEECVIDLAGFDVTIDVTNNPEIVVIDSKNLEDLSGESAGSLKINGDCQINTVNLCGDLRYLKLANEDGTYAFHPFNMTVTRVGIAVTKSAVALEAKFVANDVVREYVAENGEFGVKNMTESIYKPLNENYSFGDKNMVTARYSLMGSLDAGKLNETKEFCAYVKLGDDYYDANSVAKITPANILGLINNAYAGYDDNTKALAMKLYNDNTHLQKYLPAMGPDVKLNIAAFTNGTVTADKASYKVGEAVKLTIAPASGYTQKLYINGAPLLDNGTGSYSFVAEEGKSYAITGSFVEKNGWFCTDDWDVKNQGHFAHAPAHTDGKEATGELVPIMGTTSGMSVLVTDPSHGAQANYAIVLEMHFTNGKKAEVRLINENASGKYCLQTLGNNVLGNWNKHYNLTDAENQAVMNGEGVWYGMTLNGATLCLSVNDTVVKVINLSAEGITSVADIDQVKLVAYNFAYAVDVPYIIHPVTAEKPPVEEGNVVLTIPTFANGSVVPKKASYKAGETVSLIIAPTKGYSQKLYINGEPLMLDWKTNTYAFIATEEVYNITGSFVPSLNTAPKDANRWDASNQAHGVMNTYYPRNGDSWWMYLNGEYETLSVIAKNAEDKEGVSTVLSITVNGKEYGFRVIKEKGKYRYQRFGIAKPEGGSDWTGKDLSAAEIAALLGEGAEFKLERTGASTLTLSVNGVVYDTYTMSGVTADHAVTKVGIQHAGNKTAIINIPFKVEGKHIFYVTGGSWDLSNQHNGSLTILNKTKDGSTVLSTAKSYKEVSVTVKDYTPSKNADGTLKQGGFGMQVSFIFDNGKQLVVRMHNTDSDGKYRLQNMPEAPYIVAGWGKLAEMTQAQTEKLINGDGVKFTVKLVGANAELYVDGTKMATVALGAEYAGKTAQIKLCMNGNKNGKNIEIPFEVK